MVVLSTGSVQEGGGWEEGGWEGKSNHDRYLIIHRHMVLPVGGG